MDNQNKMENQNKESISDNTKKPDDTKKPDHTKKPNKTKYSSEQTKKNQFYDLTVQQIRLQIFVILVLVPCISLIYFYIICIFGRSIFFMSIFLLGILTPFHILLKICDKKIDEINSEKRSIFY